MLGLTDHDTTEGWDEAADVAEQLGLTLVRGIEVSCTFEGYGVHLLAYLPDPTYPPLADELQRVLDGRNSRLPATLERLRALGIDIDVARRTPGGRRDRRDGPPARRGRAGRARRRRATATRRSTATSGPQGPAYVDRYAADLETMIGTVADAGGVSVLAHPWASRHDHSALDAAGLAALQRARAWPASRSTTRTTTPATRAALRGDRRATSAWSSPAPATTTASARSTTTWAATPPRPTSSSGCSTSPPTRPQVVARRPRSRRRGAVREMACAVVRCSSSRLLTEVFVTLFVIMDPVGTIPIFLSLTRGRSTASVRRAAWQAVAVSFGVIVAFAFFGQRILDYLRHLAAGAAGAPAGCCCCWSRWSC